MIDNQFLKGKESDWQKSNLQVFWGEIAPCNHILQIYETDLVFLESLEGFAGSGILADESVVIIATAQHLEELETRLNKHCLNLALAKTQDRYIALDARVTLAKFMVDGWPDEELFNSTVKEIILRARGNGRRVRAFGEMVALLWAEGNNGATVYLEHLWNSFCEKEEFCLFCAYPKSGFTQDPNESITHICNSHSKILAGWAKPSTEIYYKPGSPYNISTKS
jgi:hypothetical protein